MSFCLARMGKNKLQNQNFQKNRGLATFAGPDLPVLPVTGDRGRSQGFVSKLKRKAL